MVIEFWLSIHHTTTTAATITKTIIIMMMISPIYILVWNTGFSILAGTIHLVWTCLTHLVNSSAWFRMYLQCYWENGRNNTCKSVPFPSALYHRLMQECKLLDLLHWVALATLRENMCLLTIPQILLERTTADITVKNILYEELLKLWFFQYRRRANFLQTNILFC